MVGDVRKHEARISFDEGRQVTCAVGEGQARVWSLVDKCAHRTRKSAPCLGKGSNFMLLLLKRFSDKLSSRYRLYFVLGSVYFLKCEHWNDDSE